VPGVIFVATTCRRRNVTIPVLGLRYRFVTLTPREFFGFQEVHIEEQPVVITDPARTVADGLDHPEYCGGIVEATKGLWHYLHSEQEEGLTASLERLTGYARRLGNRTVFKRLGYLSEVLVLLVGEYLEQWREEISSGMSLLDPRAGQREEYDTRWNLRLNVEPDRLVEWLEH